MIKQPKVPVIRGTDFSDDAMSLIDSRGDYPLLSKGSNSQSRFSLLSAVKLNGMVGSMRSSMNDFGIRDHFRH